MCIPLASLDLPRKFHDDVNSRPARFHSNLDHIQNGSRSPLEVIMRMLHLPAVALGLAGALLLSMPATSHARTYFGFTVGVFNAPPPRVFFRERPSLVYVPEERVYAVDDYDCDCDAFYTNGYWYVLDDDYWYRAHDYRGPYRAVDVRYVPQRVLYVPESHWRSYPTVLARYRAYEGYRGHDYQ